MKKRIIAVLLASLFLVGCGDKEASVNSSEAVSSTVQSGESKEGVTSSSSESVESTEASAEESVESSSEAASSENDADTEPFTEEWYTPLSKGEVVEDEIIYVDDTYGVTVSVAGTKVL